MTELTEIDHPTANTSSHHGAWLTFGSIELIAIICEAVLIIGSSIAGGTLYHLLYYGALYPIDGFLGIGLVGAILHMLIAKSQHLYEIPVLAGLERRWGRLAAGWLLVVLLLALFMFLLKIGAGVSRGSTVAFGFIGCAALIGGRAVLQRSLRRSIDNGLLAGRRAVLLGSVDEFSRLRTADLLKNFGVTEIQRFALPELATAAGDRDAIARAIKASRLHRVDEIVLAVGWQHEDRIQRICEQLRISPLPVHLLPDRTAERFLSLPAVATGALPVVEVQRAPLTVIERSLKRAFDVVVASCILLFFTPLLLITAVLIKLDTPGPVLFVQRRNGFDGRPFSILKFRTMSVLEDGDMVQQARPNDPRITRVGQVLRQRSIDELPQLINVIRGDMSLVGPRPHALAHDDKYSKLISSYAFRHHVKPGITGLAQAHGARGETPRIEDMEKRVKYDLKYIDGWSFTLDIEIMLRTAAQLFLRRAR